MDIVTSGSVPDRGLFVLSKSAGLTFFFRELDLSELEVARRKLEESLLTQSKQLTAKLIGDEDALTTHANHMGMVGKILINLDSDLIPTLKADPESEAAREAVAAALATLRAEYEFMDSALL